MSLISANFKDVFGNVTPPQSVNAIGNGASGINNILNTAITLIYMFGTLIFVFMFLYSAILWITSGGDKEKIRSARARITWAIIGIVVLALAFVILRILGGILGIKFFDPGINMPPPRPTT